MKAPNEKILKYNKVMKFDCIVSNAPYDNGLHEKFESKYFELCKGEIVWVSPLSFLLGKKQNKRITLELDKYKTDIQQINGNEYFDAAIGGTMGIVFCDMANEHNEHYVKFDGKQYNKCEEIRSYSNDELLVSFYNTVKYLFTNDNLFLHLNCIPSYPFSSLPRETNPNPNWWCFKQVAIRGNKDNNNNVKTDFYTLLPNTKENQKHYFGQYKDLIQLPNKGKDSFAFYYHFDKEYELKNFSNYIITDFSRACLMLIKSSPNLMRGELKYIPWFDFSDPVFSKSPSEIDDYLFAKYIPEVDEETGITRDEIRKHIEELLPDYYSIRNKN